MPSFTQVARQRTDTLRAAHLLATISDSTAQQNYSAHFSNGPLTASTTLPILIASDANGFEQGTAT
jgi:hypothetical protein